MSNETMPKALWLLAHGFPFDILIFMHIQGCWECRAGSTPTSPDADGNMELDRQHGGDFSNRRSARVCFICCDRSSKAKPPGAIPGCLDTRVGPRVHLRPIQLAKSRCQEPASALGHQHPEIRIGSMNRQENSMSSVAFARPSIESEWALPSARARGNALPVAREAQSSRSSMVAYIFFISARACRPHAKGRARTSDL